MRLNDLNQDCSNTFGGSKGPALKWIGCPPPTPGAAIVVKKAPTSAVLPPIPPKNLSVLYPGRVGIPTVDAAAVLGRAPQTLRRWATYQNGPLEPKRVNGRLSWPLADLQMLINRPPRRP